ncbi:MAG: ATP cone domain-containing protein, partial [Nitrososphaera sp.]
MKRYFDFFEKKLDNKQFSKQRKELEEAVNNLEVLPSMRCLMTAGPALDKDNVAGYNCSYVAVDNPKVFDEIMYVLMCGTGVGFSVERQYVNQLPEIAEEFYDTNTVISVPDSRVGWATAYRELIQLLYAGKRPKWDVSRVRPAGAILKTFGGRSSGPE